MPDGSYPFPTPKAPTGPVCDTPEWRAYAAAEGYDLDSYGEEAFAVFTEDRTEACDRCADKLFPEELNGVASWGEERLCDDCYGGRPASKQRDPDGWKAEAGR